MPPYSIPAQPFPLVLANRPPCLILIDMQRDFIEPGGYGHSLGNDVSRLAAIVPCVQQLLAGFRRLQLPVVHTREGHAPDLSDCPPAKRQRGHAALKIGDTGPMGRILIDGEPGNALLPSLAAWPNELEMVKPGKGAFYNTPLEQHLRNLQVSQLIFAGVTTEVCVQTSMREANDRGFECLLVEDATDSYFPEFKTATLNMLRAQGALVGWTATCSQTLNALEHAYGRP